MATRRKRKKVGRPRSRMTPALCKQVLEFVAAPMTLAAAARRAGVPESSVRTHRDRHPSFARALEKAEGDAKGDLLKSIRAAGEKNWTANAWLLERTFPAEYSRPEVRNEITNVNISAQDLAAAIHAGLSALAERHAPWGAPDVDDDPVQRAAAGAAGAAEVPTVPTVPTPNVTRS